MKWLIIDEKFRENKRRYIIQSVLAGLAVAVALLEFDIVRNPVVIGAFGASAFVAFTEPHKKWSGPRCLIGGYIIGLIVGGSVHYLTEFSIEHYWLLKIIHILAGALAVCLAMFFMSITDTEHAPASGIALGLVINDWDYFIILKILAGIIIISLIQRALRRWMIDIV
jgi:CBS-domain-containing membrane protein